MSTSTALRAGVMAVSALGMAAALGVPAAAAPATGSFMGSTAGPVTQVGTTGSTVSGLVVPGTFTGTVDAVPMDDPGWMMLSAEVPESVCSSSNAGTVITAHYLNPATGEAGAADLRPCGRSSEPPSEVPVHTGSGPVLFMTTQPRPEAPERPEPQNPVGSAFESVFGTASDVLFGSATLPGAGFFDAP